jgi:hypothetical protein
LGYDGQPHLRVLNGEGVEYTIEFDVVVAGEQHDAHLRGREIP